MFYFSIFWKSRVLWGKKKSQKYIPLRPVLAYSSRRWKGNKIPCKSEDWVLALRFIVTETVLWFFFWSVPSIATVTRQVRKSQFRSWMNSKQRCLCFWYSTMETKFVIFVDQEKNVWPPSCQDPRHARVPSECPPLSLWPGNTTTYTQKYICMYI